MKLFGLLLPHLIEKATTSRLWLAALNFLMARTIPFNRPHKFKIVEIGKEQIQTFAPYRKSNQNHIRGIHACAIATVAEFSAGFLLLTNLDPQKYRLIMAKLDADYSYQAKKDIVALAALSTEKLNSEIFTPLESHDTATIIMKTEVRDISGQEVAMVRTTWQIKRWDKVRTTI